MTVRRNPAAEIVASGPQPLVLAGEKLELLSLKVDGAEVPLNAVTVTEEQLIVPQVPEGDGDFIVETEVGIGRAPAAFWATALSPCQYQRLVLLAYTPPWSIHITI